MKLCFWALWICVMFCHPASATTTYNFVSSNARLTVINTQGMTASEIRDLICVARNVYHEARGRSHQNQLAVAWVTRNRHLITGRSLCEVVFESRMISGSARRIAQFSWTTKTHTRAMERAAWDQAQLIAWQVVHRSDSRDITHGATHFFERGTNPAWSRHSSARQVIDAHVFVRINSYVMAQLR